MFLPPDVRPHLPRHYYVSSKSANSSGEEELTFVSGRRRITIKGKGLQAIRQHFLPLLDGTRTVNDLVSRSYTEFSQEELEQCLTLLASNNLISLEPYGSQVEERWDERLLPQLSFFHEMNAPPSKTQQRLRNATVVVLGLSGAGAYAAIAIAACQVGRVHCVDDGAVREADLYLSPALAGAEIGLARATAVQQRLDQLHAGVAVSTSHDDLTADESVLAAVTGCDFVICSLDRGRSGVLYRVNRACLREGIPWTSCTLQGIEAVLGPTILPDKTPCYLCYKMRAIACSAEPADELDFERMLEFRNHDDSSSSENLTFAAGLLGNLAALEAFKTITGIGACSAAGGIVVVDLIWGGWQKHTILRKPWCPACFPGEAKSPNGEPTL
jgi:bacteriocin biosynthesis cyclodehydratase domain-containing protein